MNTKLIGDVTQAVVIADLMKRGKTVLTPFGDKDRYDLVVDEDGRFIRIQCKTGHLECDGTAVEFYSCSSSSHRSGGGKKDYRGQIELFAIYCPEIDQIFYVPVEEAAKRATRLRLSKSRNGQLKNIRMADNFRDFNP